MSKTLSQFRAEIGYPQEDNNSAEKFALAGGLAIEEVAAIGDPGKLIFCKNYEPNYSGGYRSKAGCEPVDGHRQPSAFVFQLVPVTITNAARVPTAVGQQVNQAVNGIGGIGPFFLGWETFGQQKYIVLSNTIEALITSSYDYGASGPTESYIDVVQFSTGTVLYTGTTSAPLAFATVTGSPTFLSDIDKASFYISLARKVARSFISPVGGELCTGPARGGFDLKGSLFGIRDLNAGNAGLFIASGPGSGTSTQGWSAVSLGTRVYFTACNSALLAIGATVTGAGSSTCTVRAVVNMFGTVGGGDSTGYFVTDAVTNGPMGGASQALKVGAITVATTPASGNVQVDNTLPAGGNYRFKRWNFAGVADNSRIYGINGVGTAFEISLTYGTPNLVVFVPIITGYGLTATTFNATPSTDTPNKIETAHDQLWLGYPGGNLQHSGYQTPTNWTAVQGADQRYLGEDITNIIGNINNTLIVTTRSRLRIIYGDVNENYQLRDLNTEAGAYEFTAQAIGGVCFLTDEGVNFYDQTANFGNYSGNSLSQGINSLLKSYMNSGRGAIEAAIQRDHSFYRLYFDKGVCFSFCIVGKELRGIGRCEYALGSTLYMSLLLAVSITVGTVITNHDATATFTIRRLQGLTGGTSDGYVITDIQLDEAAWPVGSSIYIGTEEIATIDSMTVNSVRNIWSVASTITNGNSQTPPGERIYFCSEDGYIYEDDTGGSFGILGSPVDFAGQTQFYYGSQAVNNEKYYRRMYVDIIGADAFSNISFAAEFDDGRGYRNPEVPEIVTKLLSASGFDQNSLYGVGFYGGAGKNVLRKNLHGTGVGISLVFSGSSDIAFPHTVQAVELAVALRNRRYWR